MSAALLKIIPIMQSAMIAGENVKLLKEEK